MPEYDTLNDPGVQQRLAALLRSTANDLKRPDRYADTDLGLPTGTFARLVTGTAPITWDVIRSAAAAWPVSARDLLPMHDDTSHDVRVMRAVDSAASARTLERAGLPYYEYRDTAMSRVGSYRPEWIRMLCGVDDNDPLNPAVQYNHGHLLYQLTYIVGPVNYYYSWNGTKRCIPMNTGDSVFGMPFAPHSFTRRGGEKPAYILALTYGGDLLGDPQRELAILAGHAVDDLAYSSSGEHGQLIATFTRARMLTTGELARRAEIDLGRAKALLNSACTPTEPELSRLAVALGVNVRDLLPVTSATENGVRVQFAVDARRWRVGPGGTGAYEVTELAGDRLHPHTTAVGVRPLLPDPADAAWLTTYQHQYVYALGDAATQVSWDSGGVRHHCELAVGDSMYLKPQTPVAFTGGGRLLILRIGGSVTPDVRFALGQMPEDGKARYVNDTQLWFSAEGKA